MPKTKKPIKVKLLGVPEVARDFDPHNPFQGIPTPGGSNTVTIKSPKKQVRQRKWDASKEKCDWCGKIIVKDCRCGLPDDIEVPHLRKAEELSRKHFSNITEEIYRPLVIRGRKVEPVGSLKWMEEQRKKETLYMYFQALTILIILLACIYYSLSY